MPSIYKNLVLVGTSHISKESVLEIEKTIDKEEPEIIALELDPLRFEALVTKKKRKLKLKDISKIGITGFLFNIIGAWSSKKLGKITKVSPGSDMTSAIKIAKKRKIPMVLIDRDIRLTLRRLSQKITLIEKLRFVKEIFSFSQHKKIIKNINLNEVPDKKTIKKLTSEFKKKYPSLYLVLVTERNLFMAKNLNKLMTHTNKKILAIIGAGHEEEMMKIIKNENN